MSQTIYNRVDLEKIEPKGQFTEVESAETQAAAAEARIDPPVRWWILPLSIVLCIVQALITVTAENVQKSILTSTLIAVLAFGGLLSLVLLVNPAVQLARLMSQTDGKTLGKVVGGLLLASLVLGAIIWLLLPSPFWLLMIPSIAGVIAVVVGLLFRPMPRIGAKLLRPISRSELVCVFGALLVTSGIATFGLASQLVPLVAGPWNPEWNTPQRGYSDDLNPHLNQKLFITDTSVIGTYRRGATFTAEGEPISRPLESASTGEKMSYYWTVFKAVPWGSWLPPLMYWLIFIVGCYGIFYSLTYVVLGYWANREKLIFPLARLSESLLPEEGHQHGWVPPIFRSSGFWTGFLVAFLVITYNTAIDAQWLTELSKITLGMSRNSFNAIVKGTFLQGLIGPQISFLVVFTAIGIAFLLPLEISFSSWFYLVLSKMILLIGVWMGYGKDLNDFPSDWLWVNNPATALGGGGLFCFSAVSLYRCLLEYGRLVSKPGRTTGERVRLALPVIGLVVSMIVVIGWVHWNLMQVASGGEGIGHMLYTLLWAFIFVATATLLTLGFMRIVAESGIYWFQSHTSFFHVFRTFGLGHLMTPMIIAPLLPIYSVLFLDIKTFLAPNLLNAARLKEDTSRGRTMFHATLVSCILVTAVVAVGYAVYLAHVRGAQQMNNWFYNSAPTYILDTAQRAVSAQPEVNSSIATFFCIGVVWVALTFMIRRTVFWFPHAIGFIMLANPLMDYIWFSIFLGWIAKSFVVRYGGKTTFDKVRLIFIGLIIGEVAGVLIWPVLGMIFDFQSGATLNRYGP